MTDFPPTWSPQEEGASLAGKVDEKREAQTKWGTKPVAQITTHDGETFSVFMSSVVLKEFFDEIEVGDEVKIVYRGTKTSKSGNQYRAFDTVLVS